MQKYTQNCKCNQEKSNFFIKKGLDYFFPTNKPCWRACEWEDLIQLPENSEEVYIKLFESFDLAQCLDIHQIDLDLNRTFPSNIFFSHENKQALRRILLKISIYDPLVGYVQGMNFLVSALLWHTSEAKAFWLMISLLQKYKLRRNYMPGLPGLSTHAQILELLLFEQLPSFFCYLNEYRADVTIYLTEWCFTLFAKIVPINEMGTVLHGFFQGGWCFFYKLVLTILIRLKEKIMHIQDPSDILTIIKPSEVYKKGSYSFLNSLARISETLTWEKVIKEAENVNLEKGYIEFLVASI